MRLPLSFSRVPLQVGGQLISRDPPTRAVCCGTWDFRFLLLQTSLWGVCSLSTTHRPASQGLLAGLCLLFQQACSTAVSVGLCRVHTQDLDLTPRFTWVGQVLSHYFFQCVLTYFNIFFQIQIHSWEDINVCPAVPSGSWCSQSSGFPLGRVGSLRGPALLP